MRSQRGVAPHAQESGKYKLHIPLPRRNSTGADVGADGTTWKDVPSVDFSTVYVARAERDTAASINAKLKAGLHVAPPGAWPTTRHGGMGGIGAVLAYVAVSGLDGASARLHCAHACVCTHHDLKLRTFGSHPNSHHPSPCKK